MRPPNHHVPDADLVAYAAGALEDAVQMWVACHLTYCPTCREEVSLLEAVGGALLGGQPHGTTEGSPPGRERLAAPAVKPPTLSGTPSREPVIFPRPLRDRLGPLHDVSFRAVGYGVRIASVEAEGSARTFVVDFPPGLRIPTHGHEGIERGLVLRGGFSDGSQHFATGDCDVHEGHDDRHSSVIDDDGPCTALFVTEGPASVSSPLMGLLADWWLHR